MRAQNWFDDVVGEAERVRLISFQIDRGRLSIHYQEREAWRTRQIEAAQMFSAAYVDLGILILPCVAPERLRRVSSSDGPPPGFEDVLHRLVHAGSQLGLVFGVDSTPSKQTDEMAGTVGVIWAIWGLLSDADGGEAAELSKELGDKLDELEDQFENFVDGAHRAIAPRTS